MNLLNGEYRPKTHAGTLSSCPHGKIERSLWSNPLLHMQDGWRLRDTVTLDKCRSCGEVPFYHMIGRMYTVECDCGEAIGKTEHLSEAMVVWNKKQRGVK